MKTTRAVTYCPACGRENDSHTTGGPHSPIEGDFAICMECTYIGVFTFADGPLSVRHPTPEETGAMQRNPNLMRIVQAMSQERHGNG